MPPNQNGEFTSSRTAAPETGIPVPPRVYAELDALQTSGTANMLTEVRAGLEYFDFDAARNWIQSNPEQYVEAIMHGFRPTDPDAVPDIDIDEPPTPVMSNELKLRTDASSPNQQVILDHLRNIQHLLPRATTYYKHGSWRYCTPLTEGERELYERFADAIGFQPQNCYHNSLLTILSFGDDYPISYVEGYVMADDMHAPLAHAWLELGDKVIEPTLPSGPDPKPSDTYFGVKFDTETAIEKFLTDQTAEPLASNYTPVSAKQD